MQIEELEATQKALTHQGQLLLGQHQQLFVGLNQSVDVLVDVILPLVFFHLVVWFCFCHGLVFSSNLCYSGL